MWYKWCTNCDCVYVHTSCKSYSYHCCACAHTYVHTHIFTYICAYICNIHCANTRFVRSGIKLPLHYVVCHASLLVTAPCIHATLLVTTPCFHATLPLASMQHCWSPLPLASILTAGHCPLPPSSLLVTVPCLPSSLYYVAGDEDCSCRGHFPGGASGGKGGHTGELHARSSAWGDRLCAQEVRTYIHRGY